MGDRCIKRGDDKAGSSLRIAVFDLDGTVYRGATFRRYLLYWSRMLMRRGRVFSAILIMWRYLLSKGGLYTHLHMKYLNSRLLEGMLTDADHRNFARTLPRGVNGEVIALMQRLKDEGYLTVLSTASPEVYCRQLAEMLGFDRCHATAPAPMREQDYDENRGMRKVEGIRKLETETGGCLHVVVTDHYDDLPLLSSNAGGINRLVNPSPETVRRVAAEGVAVEVM